MEVALVGAPEQSDDGWALFEAEPVVLMDAKRVMPVYGIDGVEDSDLRRWPPQPYRGSQDDFVSLAPEARGVPQAHWAG